MLPEGMFRSPGAVSTAFAACFLVVPALSRKLPGAWKALFCLLVGLYAAPLLVVSLDSAFSIGGAMAGRVARLLVGAKPVAALLLASGLEAWERFQPGRPARPAVRPAHGRPLRARPHPFLASDR